MEQTKINKNSDFIPLENKENQRKRKNPFADRKEEKERRQKKKARLIVRNISYKCNEEDLKKHFSQWGELEEVNLLKRADGRLVGCAFVQYAAINHATKAILKGNNTAIKGRAVYVDWAVGKDEYTAQKKGNKAVKKEEVKAEKQENGNKNDDTDDEDDDDNDEENVGSKKKAKLDEDAQVKESSAEDSDGEENEDEENTKEEESDSATDDDDEEETDEDQDVDDAEEHDNDVDIDDDDDDESDDKDDKKLKSKLKTVKKEKHISNDVKEGCTIFLKNVPFDVEDDELRKLCRKYGLIHYAIINREPISGHSKGTAFVKFKTKESADLCLQAGSKLMLMDQIVEAYPALSKDEIRNQANEKNKSKDGKDSRNLYLAREGLIMSGSKAAEGVSASDMAKRHELERVKTQVLKNLNRFVSRNRLSIHNLPLHYDDEKLRQMAITYTGFKPHECRVMRDNKITAEYPKGKPKGFGFLSFNTHQQALEALRKMNNNPNIFSDQHRPIVAFSIEDRAVHKIKEKRQLKSKLNNPTYQEKMERRKAVRREKLKSGKFPRNTPQDDDKAKLQRHIKKLADSRAAKPANKRFKSGAQNQNGEPADFVGTAAKPGTSMRMRSNKKLNEQAQEHKKRVRENKRKQKQQKIRQTHLAERKAEIRPKQGRKVERDDLQRLVNKYKNMLNVPDSSAALSTHKNPATASLKKSKPKRTKWYQE